MAYILSEPVTFHTFVQLIVPVPALSTIVEGLFGQLVAADVHKIWDRDKNKTDKNVSTPTPEM